MAVKTYVHEPVDNIELVGKQGMVGTLGAGGVPGGLSAIRREDILEWELEVERFSSASARLAL